MNLGQSVKTTLKKVLSKQPGLELKREVERDQSMTLGNQLTFLVLSVFSFKIGKLVISLQGPLECAILDSKYLSLRRPQFHFYHKASLAS